MNDAEPEELSLEATSYEACGGREHFLSIEDVDRELLVGFCRLRFPGRPARRPELEDAALLRELHVYGSSVALGDDAGDDSHQHRGHGRRLMERAEAIAADAGYGKLSVISGIGAREYYREKLGYRQDGPYVSTRL